jgi:succinyl-CoA synthetase alpha subunit
MAIIVGEGSAIIIQGITGKTGMLYADRMAGSATPLVGGVTPGRGGQRVFGLPVFDTVVAAVGAVGADASLVVVPPHAVKAAVAEALDAGIRMVSVYTENVPAHDAADLVATAAEHGARLLGPNSAGVASAGTANMSDIDDAILEPGRVGIVSKSGTLTYEVIDDLKRFGLGVSTVVCLGGDLIVGTRHDEVVELFARDAETDCVVLLGEIGGRDELAAAARWRELAADKPLVAYIAGHAAPIGRRMGHAGAIVGGIAETAAEKSLALERAGARVAWALGEVSCLVARSLGITVHS